MPNLQELINQLATRASLTAENPTLKTLLENESLKQIDLPQEFSGLILTKLMNAEQAKKNPEIKTHFHKEALDGVDSELSQLLSEIGDEELKTAVEGEKSTYKRIPLMVKKVKELEAKAAGAKGSDKKDLVDKINELNDQIKQAKLSAEAEKTTLSQQHDLELTNLLISSDLKTYDYGIGVPSEVAALTAKTLIEADMQRKKAKVKRDGYNITLVNADSPDLPYTEANEKVEWKTYVEKLLAENKMLKVTDSTAAAPPYNPAPTYQQPSGKVYDYSGVDRALSDLSQKTI